MIGGLMQRIQRLAVMGLGACFPVLGGCQTPQSSAPAVTRGAQSTSAPILQSVTIRKDVPTGTGGFVSFVPDFHFIAPNGNAIVLRRELVDTNGAFAQTQIRSATINIPAEAQKRGAVISGGWPCGTAQYYVTLRAYIMDAEGNRSNSLEYTFHCNGG
jgi:hypothetical protein